MTITIKYSLLSMSMWSRQGTRQYWIDNITFIAKECKRIRNILNKYGHVASLVHCPTPDVDQECENILNSSSRRWIEGDDYGEICTSVGTTKAFPYTPGPDDVGCGDGEETGHTDSATALPDL